MQKFEYKLVSIDISQIRKPDYQSEISKNFNQYGAEGWELVKLESVIRPSSWYMGSKTEGFIAAFKRPLP